MGRAKKYSKSISKKLIFYANELKVNKGYQGNTNDAYSVSLFST